MTVYYFYLKKYINLNYNYISSSLLSKNKLLSLEQGGLLDELCEYFGFEFDNLGVFPVFIWQESRHGVVVDWIARSKLVSLSYKPLAWIQ